ncbi:MAG: hypothetical protein Q8K60_03080 [Parachlamydiaceae bacterium]|nr:hypothetical protein [Parachlamydiaceae bacterium]
MIKSILGAFNYISSSVKEPKSINEPYTLLITFEKSYFLTKCIKEDKWSAAAGWKGQKKFQEWVTGLTEENLLIISEIFKEKNSFAIESKLMYSSPSKENLEYVVRASTVIGCLEEEINKRKQQPAYMEPRLEQISLLVDRKK